MVQSFRSRSMMSLALAVFFSMSCGGKSPSDSTPPVTLPPAPAATAAPTAPPTPLPGMTCNLPPVSRASDNCSRQGEGQFVAQVDAAIQKTMRENPSNFRGALILDRPAFRVALQKNLEAVSGLCVQWDADRDGHRELMVKNSNNFSEQYHVELSNGNVRMGEGAYRATCYPANFPVNPEPLLQRGDCKLPSSRDVGCDRLENPQYLGLMEGLATDIARERTDLVRDGYVVGDVNAYYAEIVKRLVARGYCAFFDGHDIALKNTNDFNEQYHVVYSWGQTRRGESSYRATCRPAAF
jgi:hypothetical protein